MSPVHACTLHPADVHSPGLVARSARERIRELGQVAFRDRIASDAVLRRPLSLWTMVCAEQLVDPWEMHGEVLVESGRFRTVVPVMKARSDDKRFHHPREAPRNVRVNEHGVERNEYQIGGRLQLGQLSGVTNASFGNGWPSQGTWRSRLIV